MLTRRLVVAVSLTALYVLSPLELRAQTGDDSPTVIELSKRLADFFEAIMDRRVATAYADLLNNSPLNRPERQTQREQLIKKTGELEAIYGRPRGFERVAIRRTGADLITLHYLYKCDNFPVAWHITYYRGGRTTDEAFDTWKVISVKFDTDLDELPR